MERVKNNRTIGMGETSFHCLCIVYDSRMAGLSSSSFYVCGAHPRQLIDALNGRGGTVGHYVENMSLGPLS